MDRSDQETRSRIMSKIRSTDTTPEILLRKSIYAAGFRYRKNYLVAGIRVDIVFLSKKLAIFVDGCFWHKCPVHYRPPKSNLRYWIPKLKHNVERDRKETMRLKKSNWKVIRIWEHEIKRNPGSCVAKVVQLAGG